MNTKSLADNVFVWAIEIANFNVYIYLVGNPTLKEFQNNMYRHFARSEKLWREIAMETRADLSCRGGGTGPADPATAGPIFS